MQAFLLSEEQAKAILEMRLQRLTGLEQEKIVTEAAELEKLIARLRQILSSNLEISEHHQRRADGAHQHLRRRAQDIRSSRRRARSAGRISSRRRRWL